MDAYLKEYNEREVMDHITEIYGDIEICGQVRPSGWVLKEIDEDAFSQFESEMPEVWVCAECGKEYGVSSRDPQEDASECCMFYCDECGNGYPEEEDALNCCMEDEDEDI